MSSTESAVQSFTEEHRLRLWGDFRDFAGLQLRSKDFDPVYPVMAHIMRDLEEEQRLWMMLVYLLYYSLPAGLKTYAAHPEPPFSAEEVPYELLKQTTGIERRGFRDPAKMARHLDSLLRIYDHHGSWGAWLRTGFSDDPRRNWMAVQENVRAAWGNGRWAGYKTAELLQKVVGWSEELEPSDMGHAFSSGPRQGQALLYEPEEGNDAETIERLEAQGREVHEWLRASGVPVPDLAVTETMLCDFHTMINGGYYVGHDIDLMQEHMEALEKDSWERNTIFGARMEALPRSYLGELSGRSGVDKARKREYADKGVIRGR